LVHGNGCMRLALAVSALLQLLFYGFVESVRGGRIHVRIATLLLGLVLYGTAHALVNFRLFFLVEGRHLVVVLQTLRIVRTTPLHIGLLDDGDDALPIWFFELARVVLQLARYRPRKRQLLF